MTVSSGMKAVVCSCTPRRARRALAGVGVEAEHGHRPGRGRAQSLEDLDERGLAGPVGAEQSDNLAAGSMARSMPRSASTLP